MLHIASERHAEWMGVTLWRDSFYFQHCLIILELLYKHFAEIGGIQVSFLLKQGV